MANPLPTTEEARKELVESLTEDQWRVIKLMVSAIARGWDVVQASLTPRQKELLRIMGEDRLVSETINDIERIVKK